MPFSTVDLIVVAVVAIIVILASTYIVKAKKKGVKCIGCPNGCSCSRGDGSSCAECQSCKDE